MSTNKTEKNRAKRLRRRGTPQQPQAQQQEEPKAGRGIDLEVGAANGAVALRLSVATTAVTLTPKAARELAAALTQGAARAEAAQQVDARKLAELTKAVGGPKAMTALITAAARAKLSPPQAPADGCCQGAADVVPS